VLAVALLAASSVGCFVPAARAGTVASASSWSAYYWNPSGRALGGPIAAGSSTAASLVFASGYVALLTTSEKALTGDLTGKTLTDTLSVSGVTATGTFQDQNGGGCTPDVQSVRFYLASPGFAYTNYWWSNPISVQLSGNLAPITIVGNLADPSQWSDWNGQGGSSSPAVTAGFNEAVSKVSTVGLSFGGGCFFENGVTTSDGSGTFSSSFSES
jgi:hypothetical protein